MSVFVLRTDASTLTAVYNDISKGKDHPDVKTGFSTLIGNASTDWADDRISVLLDTLQNSYPAASSSDSAAIDAAATEAAAKASAAAAAAMSPPVYTINGANTIKQGTSIKLTIAPVPTKSVVWTIDNSIATIDRDGTVTAVDTKDTTAQSVIVSATIESDTPITHSITIEPATSLSTPPTSAITINYINYANSDPSTDFANPVYYSRSENKEKLFFALVNGANTMMSPGGGGTNAAITKINSNLFNNLNVLFDSEQDYTADPQLKPILQTNSITIPATQFIAPIPSKLTYDAGSVFVSQPESSTHIGDKQFLVYHIKGIQWKSKGDPDEKLSVELVKAYYTAILNDFTTKIITDNTGNWSIHLSPVPGMLYNGTIITENALREAVSTFQANYKGNPFQINIGLMPAVAPPPPPPI